MPREAAMPQPFPPHLDEIEVLATSCPPGETCPKVARLPGTGIAVVGKLVTDPDALALLGVGADEAAVVITEPLYQEGAAKLGHV